MTNDQRNPNDEQEATDRSFVIRISTFFRHSSLGIRHFILSFDPQGGQLFTKVGETSVNDAVPATGAGAGHVGDQIVNE